MMVADVPSGESGERAYYSVSQAAALLGVSRVSIWRWMSSGQLEASRLGQRTTRIKHEDLERLMKGFSPYGARSRGAQRRTRRAEGAALEGAGLAFDAPTEREHLVQFYDADAFLLDAVADFIGGALLAGDGAIVVATEPHRRDLDELLQARGIDLTAGLAAGQLASLDAAETLSKFMVDGRPDADRFLEVIGGLVAKTARGRQHVRVFGEMVALLAAAGNDVATIQLEELWNDLQRNQRFSLFCAYPLGPLAGEDLDGLHHHVSEQHSRVMPTEIFVRLATTDQRVRAFAELELKAKRLEREIAERKLMERRLAVQYEVTRVLAESETLREAGARILQTLCEMLGWEVGGLWALDREAGVLRLEKLSHLPSADVAEFEAATLERTFLPGVGMPGRVWARRTACWIADVLQEENFPRARYAARAGLHAAFGFPIYRGDEFMGAIDFFSTEIREPDEAVLAMMEGIGGQIGQFIERKRAAEARDTALSELRELLATREEFLSSAAHDLKNPLAGIQAHAGLLRLRAEKGLALESSHLLQEVGAIEASTRKMTALLNELLDVSRLQIGQPLDLAPCRVDIVPLAQRVIGEHEQAAAERPIRLDSPAELWGEWDVERLERVFWNLLSNAIKYSPEGGEILVSLSPDSELGRPGVTMTIRDRGLGIPADELRRIFGRFVRGSNVVGRFEGTGIGLTSVRHIVEGHGGTIAVQSEEGAGSTFTVRLPLTPEAQS